MALVAGVNIPDQMHVEFSLQKIYGVGPAVARRVLEISNITNNPRVKDLTEDELSRIRAALDRSGQAIEGDLRRAVQMNIRRLIDIGCYRGLRHRRGLPARGQRTRTNARTKRGGRRAIAGKKRTVTKK
ncbi:MAG: 30S ribosomal protein S13 [SAR202 cluster bacterium]|nr:30S ribosomal protein S13 [SAR202 cluster bacterium]